MLSAAHLLPTHMPRAPKRRAPDCTTGKSTFKVPSGTIITALLGMALGATARHGTIAKALTPGRRILPFPLNVAQEPQNNALAYEFHCTGKCNAVEQYRRHQSNMEKFLQKTHGIAKRSNAQTRPNALRSTVTDPTLKLDKKDLDALQDMFIAAALSRLPPLKSAAEPGMGGLTTTPRPRKRRAPSLENQGHLRQMHNWNTTSRSM